MLPLTDDRTPREPSPHHLEVRSVRDHRWVSLVYSLCSVHLGLALERRKVVDKASRHLPQPLCGHALPAPQEERMHVCIGLPLPCMLVLGVGNEIAPDALVR